MHSVGLKFDPPGGSGFESRRLHDSVTYLSGRSRFCFPLATQMIPRQADFFTRATWPQTMRFANRSDFRNRFHLTIIVSAAAE